VRPLVLSDWLAGILFWTAFSVWYVFGGRRSLKRSGGGETVADRGSLRLIVGLGTLGLVLGFLAAWFDTPSWTPPGGRWALLAVGLALMWAGIALRQWSMTTLGRFFRQVVAVQADHRVVTAGPYRVLRHPSYTGTLLTTIGIGVSLASWASVLACFLLPLPAYLWRIRAEEAALEAARGAEYRAYEARTKRLVPGVW
jgi:protein-S-isoprenylcysteine O-methyltransferase